MNISVISVIKQFNHLFKLLLQLSQKWAENAQTSLIQQISIIYVWVYFSYSQLVILLSTLVDFLQDPQKKLSIIMAQ